MVAVVGAAAYGLTRGVQVAEEPAPSCTFSAISGGTPYSLDPGQTQEASVIAGVGSRLGLPDHAVTVALATALQETHLRNLPYGDRDSVGLFQQRPSEGWGTRAQILDPVYAATAFYARLRQVPGWEVLAVADAAQAVQHSADASAYAGWEDQARTMAVDLTGEVPVGLACRLPSFGGAVPPPGALEAAGASELGSDPFQADPGPAVGWRSATWLVAHAYNYHLHSVSYAGRRWTPESGRWMTHPVADTASVTVS